MQGIVSLPHPIDGSSRVKNEIPYKRRKTSNPLFSLPEPVLCASSEGLASNIYLSIFQSVLFFRIYAILEIVGG